LKWVPVRSSHLCIENEKAWGLPVRQLMIMIMSAIPVSITREPVGQRRGRIRVAV
jgi:hypothetical protein